ncbi:hypothetical protein KKA17_09680 [bacterium]|nr:hypothetical protein [bacterium]MBU1884574.1 hypothetical protein [bacterium]
MFTKLLGKDKAASAENVNDQLVEYISKIGITEMRSLLLGQIDRFKVDENTIVEILRRLTYQDGDKRFLESSDNDIKLKKAFDVVITAANSKKMSVEAVELIEKFINMYKDLIEAYDTRNKQIYMHKLTKAIELSIAMVEQISSYINKMAVINDV